MLSHLSLGVKNLDLSAAFYDSALSALGYQRIWSNARGIGYGPPGAEDNLAIFAEGEANTPLAAGPGFHLALKAPDRAAVDRFYESALANGGRGDGAPGLRTQYHATYYAAFVIDPDGHRLEAVHQ